MYEKLRRQNKIIQLLQNIALTISIAALISTTLMFSGLVDGLWEEIGAKSGPFDDVEGYALIVQGTAGVLGSFLMVIMVVLLIVLVSITVFFWVMFVVAYAKKATVKRYCTCTGIEAGVKTVLIGVSILATIGDALKQLFMHGTEGLAQVISKNANLGTALWLLCLAGSVKVLWNIHIMKKKEETV